MSKASSARAMAKGGKKDRCRKGKSCSATCISSWKQCLVEMGDNVSSFVRSLQNRLKGVVRRVSPWYYRKRYESAKRDLLGNAKLAAIMGNKGKFDKASQNLLKLQSRLGDKLGDKDMVSSKQLKKMWRDGELKRKIEAEKGKYKPIQIVNGSDASMFDSALGIERLTRIGDRGYNGWSSSYGGKDVGSGAFGYVVKDSSGLFVKRGSISDAEATLVKMVGNRDLGPKLIAADLDGYRPNNIDPNARAGRIAMTEVKGSQLSSFGSPGAKIGNTTAADSYWKALADLHRIGVAHNDAHAGNMFIDDQGKGRWVDFGLAQRSPKAALSEALGAFSVDDGGNRLVSGDAFKALDRGGYSSWSGRGSGNWQTVRQEETGLPGYFSARGNNDLMDKFRREQPSLGRIVSNLDNVRSELRRMGFSEDESAALQLFGIRSPIENFKKGVWAKMSDKQAQKLIEMLYEGV